MRPRQPARNGSLLVSSPRESGPGYERATGDAVELFVGQMIALLPQCTSETADAVQQRLLRTLFPRAGGRFVPSPKKPQRPRVYSLIADGRGGGTLAAGGTEIEVLILPLDVRTPSEATAFRITAMSGRALRVRGVAEGDGTA